MSRACLAILFVICLSCANYHNVAVDAAKGGGKVGSAALPRKKSKGSTLAKATGFMGSGVMNRMFRELKISFCSELEAATLQVAIAEKDVRQISFALLACAPLFSLSSLL